MAYGCQRSDGMAGGTCGIQEEGKGRGGHCAQGAHHNLRQYEKSQEAETHEAAYK